MTTENEVRKMATRQKIRLGLLFFMMLTFPITMNYFSVYLIIESAGEGVVAFTLLFWSAFVITALFLGRAVCGYLCPLGCPEHGSHKNKRLFPRTFATPYG